MHERSLKNFCFATLALREPYRRAATNLANDLAVYAPGKRLIVLTDDPRSFQNQSNVVARFHRQQGLFSCWNDKRFAVYTAFQFGDPVIFYDADTRISQPLPDKVEMVAPLSTDWTPSLEEQTARYQNERERSIISKACESFGIDLKRSVYIDDNFYVIRQDQGREITFLQIWGKVAEEFDLLGIRSNDGTCMGIAAAVIGWNASQGDAGIGAFNTARTHLCDGGKRAEKNPHWKKRFERIVKGLALLQRRVTFAFRR